MVKRFRDWQKLYFQHESTSQPSTPHAVPDIQPQESSQNHSVHLDDL